MEHFELLTHCTADINKSGRSDLNGSGSIKICLFYGQEDGIFGNYSFLVFYCEQIYY